MPATSIATASSTIAATMYNAINLMNLRHQIAKAATRNADPGGTGDQQPDLKPQLPKIESSALEWAFLIGVTSL